MRAILTSRVLVLLCTSLFYINMIYCQCNNWLSVEGIKSGMQIGNLSIMGNNVTVEAKFERREVYDLNYHGGELVSKHRFPGDVNYLLRPNLAAITTTNGYYQVQAGCNIDTGKTYHVAFVYDGDSLKFYRNGYLMNAVAASGNLIQNNYLTTIGSTAYQPTTVPSDFLGYVNEVRIWNIARTKSDINQYMNIKLPTPTIQAGLLAYYTFDDITNKQGNSAWNGTIIGTAYINQTNPSCSTFVADSCAIILPLSLKDFRGKTSNSKIELRWVTEQEINTSYFEVQRSIDNINFKTISIIPAVRNGGNQNNYFSNDNNPIEGKNFYRLKMIDVDGKITYSQVIIIIFNNKQMELNVFPNPTMNLLSIQSNFTGESLDIRMTDIAGRQVMQTKKANSSTLQISIPNLKAGTYILIISDGIQETKRKIVKIK